MRPRFLMMWTVVALLAVAACGSSTTVEQGASAKDSPTPNPAANSPAAAASSPAALPRAYDPTRNARADVAAALEQARTDHKYVLVDFGANWCPDCVVLDRLYRKPRVRGLLDRGYHLVTVDVGEFDRNLALSCRYGDVIKGGIPALVILDAQGRVKTTTKDGSFANARRMNADDVYAFLSRWAPRASR